MRLYDLDTKVGRFYAYVEIHRALREIEDRPSAKQIAEHLGGDPAQIAHALKKMAEYDGVHREEIQRRTDNTPAYAKFRYWNKKTWRESIESAFGMTVPIDASKHVILKGNTLPKRIIRAAVKSVTNVSKLPERPILTVDPEDSALSDAQIRTLSDEQISVTLYRLTKEVALRLQNPELKKAS